VEKALEGRNAQESTAAPMRKLVGLSSASFCRGNEASKRMIRVVERELAVRGPGLPGGVPAMVGAPKGNP
jgi:hypothetical protein